MKRSETIGDAIVRLRAAAAHLDDARELLERIGYDVHPFHLNADALRQAVARLADDREAARLREAMPS